MSLRLEVPAELEQRILEEARALNIAPQKLLGQALFTGLSSLAGQSKDRTTLLQELRTRLVPQVSTEWESLLQEFAGHGKSSVVLPIDATSRESIYGDDLR